MTSKEALERLYDGYQYGMNGRSLYDIISQDLDRLEKLEKEIIHIHTGYGIELSTEYDKRLELEKENVKLKKALEILKEEPYILVIGLENFAYDKFDNTYYYEEELYSQDLGFRNKLYVISKEKYNLLKEVLE